MEYPTGEIQEIIVPLDKVNKLNYPFVLIGFAPCFVYVYLHTAPQFISGINDVLVPWFFPPVLLAGYLFHELLHIFTFSGLGLRPITHIKVGFRPSHLLPFFYPVYPLKAWAMRIAMFIPWLLVGFVPMVFGLLHAIPELFMPGVFFMCFASGDLAWLYATWKVPMKDYMEINPKVFGCLWISAEKVANDRLNLET